MTYKLRPHQERAYRNIKNNLPRLNRLQYISACGTGKTLVGFNIVQDALKEQDQTLILFFPSLALIKQTYEAYLDYGMNTKEIDILFVCSDETVYCGADEECIEISKDEVPFEVTTEAEKISTFLEGNSKNKVIFSTYHSSRILGEAFSQTKRSADLALYDEAHKTASSNDSYYNYSLDDENIKILKRLFMTATPKHKNVLDKEHDELLFSMNNPERYGEVVEQYSIRKAIDEGVVVPYKIIVSIVDDEEVEAIRAKNTSDTLKNMDLKKAAKIIALSKSVEKYNIKKGLVFAERISRSKEYSKAYDELMPGFNIHLDSNNTTKQVYGAFEHMAKASKSMLFNATLLSEGVDVPSVDLVAFMEKTESSINIAQRIGRATRLDPNNPEKIGYVFIPIFLSSPDEDIYDAALKSGDFNEMLEIINVMAEQDEILYSVFSSSRKDPKGSKEKLKSFIEFDDNTNRFNISEREYLRDKIELEVLDSIASSWDKYYELLKEYYEEFGKLPAKSTIYKDFKLGIWLNTQRSFLANNTLLKNKIKRLDDVDPTWKMSKHELAWNRNYELLKEYYDEFNCLPTQSTKYKGVNIGRWHTKNRLIKKLSREKKDLLNLITPTWDN
ncbi:MAG: DEAD/DEAH box helicase family protein [Campylobacterales bacterium]|nr:DEAD/DEAH box helicase family protein [Campylobacterales bacterium]